MTLFSTFLTTVLNKLKVLENCSAYSAIASSTDYPSFLSAGCGYYAWAYQADVVDDDDLDGMPESDLNDFGIYINNITLTNPVSDDYQGCNGDFIELETANDSSVELFFAKNATSILNIDGNNDCTVYVMAGHNLTINISGNAHINIKAFNDCIVTVNASNNSSVCIEASNQSDISVIADDSSTIRVSLRNRSVLSYTGNDTSNLILSAYAKSSAGYILNDSATIETHIYNLSTVIAGSLP